MSYIWFCFFCIERHQVSVFHQTSSRSVRWSYLVFVGGSTSSKYLHALSTSVRRCLHAFNFHDCQCHVLWTITQTKCCYWERFFEYGLLVEKSKNFLFLIYFIFFLDFHFVTNIKFYITFYISVEAFFKPVFNKHQFSIKIRCPVVIDFLFFDEHFPFWWRSFLLEQNKRASVVIEIIKVKQIWNFREKIFRYKTWQKSSLKSSIIISSLRRRCIIRNVRNR